MKAKLFVIFLAALLIVPISGMAKKKRKGNLKARTHQLHEYIVTRSPIAWNIDVNESNNCLQIIFQFPLQDADITVTDKNGNTVINEQQTLIYEGRTLYVNVPEAYPYMLEVTSPAVDITTEISWEEN